MHRLLALIPALCLLFAALQPDRAQAQLSTALPERVITWNLVDWPPFYLLSDGQPPASMEALGEGVIDGFLRRVLQRLPQYEHRFVMLTGARAELERKAGLGLCSASSMRTPERLQDRYFTPAMPTVQQHLVMQRSRVAALDLPTAGVSLRTLFRQAPELQGLILSKRHYGPELEPLLRQAPNVRAIAAPKAGNLLNMLEAGRMDFSLEYPMVLAHHLAQQRPGREAPLVSLPIVEAGEPPVGYFSCNRNAWGRAVMADLDKALREVAAQPEVARLYERWLTPSEAARERPRMERFFAARARGGVKIE
ncbi:TIGR02285 family protein [Kinneretia asaccharophila]|uniref:Uncharacterized protein (TIGR02285 family) n=1 Tax=Roseateles asaccharophilus TaxID=582607 RepID=A0A4R6N7P4_9BURK|nr:TIGR02285 family protein [Roseateles asaccharophilus]MDN3546175.1 TIGR02285 family protein [Roseateles asaccharophilus]TDP11094.1 uncharacterized protein (TIGR02285 family) [Roseateles asaccharophilus]